MAKENKKVLLEKADDKIHSDTFGWMAWPATAPLVRAFSACVYTFRFIRS